MNATPDSPRYRNDTWSLEDGLGLGRAGDQVARMALEVDPPFTIGVTGKWGSGKTSVMRRAFVTLGGQPIQQALMFSEAPGKEYTGGDWERWLTRQRTAPRPWTGRSPPARPLPTPSASGTPPGSTRTRVTRWCP